MSKELRLTVELDGKDSGAAEAIRAVGKELKDIGAATDAARAPTDSLQKAFATLGMGVASDAARIEKEILDINQALMVLARSTDVTGAQFDEAFTKGKTRIAELEQKLKSADGATDAMRGKVSMLSGVIGQLGAMFGGLELARQFVAANIEVENLNRTFAALTGSVAAAAEEMAYASDVANRLGLEGVSAAKAYADLSASTKGTAVEGKATRDVFEAVAMSMSAAGKSSADTEGALLALGQMASKGVVQMEELRGQLGERLPGAMKAAADGMGITVQELGALVESGRMTAEEIFPALAKGLNDLYGAAAKNGEQTATLTQTWNRFKNTMTEFWAALGDGGGLAAMKVGLDTLGATVIIVTNVFLTLGKTIGTFFGALASGDIGIRGFSENAKRAFAEIELEAQTRMVNVAKSNGVLAASLDDAGKKALQAAIENDTLAEATQRGSEAAGAASSDWTRLNVAYANLEAAAKVAMETAEKNVEAKKAEGAASVALAQAFGTETEKRQAQAAAAQANAAAESELAEQKKTYFAIAEANVTSLKAEVEAQGQATAAQQKTIEELEKSADRRRAEADAAVAQAEASKLVAAQAQAEVLAVADNSARVNELRAAYDEATAAVRRLREDKAAGKDVTEQLAQAERDAGAAALLYRDALSDQQKAIVALNNEKQAAVSVEQAGVRLAIERLKAGAEVARALGNEHLATQNLLEVKRLEIQLAELTAKAKQAEADAARLLAQAKIEEIRRSGDLTDAKKAEIRALEASVEVKRIEAEIAGVTADKMRELSDITWSVDAAMRASAGAAGVMGQGLRGVGADADSTAGSLNRAADAAERLRRIQGGEGGLRQDAGGVWKNSKGQWTTDKGEVLKDVNGKPVTDATSFLDKGSREPIPVDIETILYKQGASVAEAKAAGGYFNEIMNRKLAQTSGRTGVNGPDFDAIARSAADQALLLARAELAGAAVDIGTSFNDSLKKNLATMGSSMTSAGGVRNLQSTTARAGSEAAASTTVVFNVAGRQTKVNVGSSSDVENLRLILQQLEFDASRSN